MAFSLSRSLNSLSAVFIHFFPKMKRKGKTEAGELCRQKQVSVSGGTEMDKAWLWEGEVGFAN